MQDYIEEKIVCPVCGGAVRWDDTYDQDMYESEFVYRCGGTCVNCGETIEYNQVYEVVYKETKIIDHYQL